MLLFKVVTSVKCQGNDIKNYLKLLFVGIFTLFTTVNLLYYAMYNAHFCAHISEGKLKMHIKHG